MTIIRRNFYVPEGYYKFVEQWGKHINFQYIRWKEKTFFPIILLEHDV
jgi:hypothetical protein